MQNVEHRLRRARKTRHIIKENGKYRLTVHRTPKHIYAQIITPDCKETIAAASTLLPDVKQSIKGHTGNVSAAEKVGEIIASKALEKGIEEVAFDRSGFIYHGRVKALAEAARKNGLKF